MTIIYKKYSKNYEEQVVDLLNVCFPKKDITPESFRWKHFDRFFENKQKAMIAIDREKVCSFVCFTPMKVIYSGKVYLFYSCSVQATHPAYRRRGIVSHLTGLIEKELGKNTDYFGFSNQSGLQIDLYSKKIAYKVIGQMYTYYFLPSPLQQNITLSKIKDIPKKFPGNSRSEYFEIYKNRKYLRWRFIKNPKNIYEIYEFVKDQKHLGLVVLKKETLKYEVLDIILRDMTNFKTCFKAILHLAFTKKVLIISFTCLPAVFTEKLLPRFYSKRKIKIYFTAKSRIKRALKKDNWFLQGGDVQ